MSDHRESGEDRVLKGLGWYCIVSQ